MSRPDYFRMMLQEGSWLITVRMSKRRSNVDLAIQMADSVSNRTLSYPKDVSEMRMILADEFWPPFVLEEMVSFNPEREGLF